MTIKIQLAKKTKHLIQLSVKSDQHSEIVFDLLWNDSGTTHLVMERSGLKSKLHPIVIDIEKNSESFQIKNKNFNLTINNTADCKLQVMNGHLDLSTNGLVTLSKKSQCSELGITAEKYLQNSHLTVEKLHLHIATLVTINEKARLKVTNSFLLQGKSEQEAVKEIKLFGYMEIPTAKSKLLVNTFSIFGYGQLNSNQNPSDLSNCYTEVNVLDLKQNAKIFLHDAYVKVNEYLINEGIFAGKRLSVEFVSNHAVDSKMCSRNEYVFWAEEFLELKGRGGLYNNGLLGCHKVVRNSLALLCNHALLTAKTLAHIHAKNSKWQFINHRVTSVANFNVQSNDAENFHADEVSKTHVAILNTSNAILYISEIMNVETFSTWKNSGILISLRTIESNGKFIHAERALVNHLIKPEDIKQIIGGYTESFFENKMSDRFISLRKMRENHSTQNNLLVSFHPPKHTGLANRRTTDTISGQLRDLFAQFSEANSDFLKAFSCYDLNNASYCIAPTIGMNNDVDNAGIILAEVMSLHGNRIKQHATGQMQAQMHCRIVADSQADINSEIRSPSVMIAAENLNLFSDSKIEASNRATIAATNACIDGKVLSKGRTYLLIEEEGYCGKSSLILGNEMTKFYAKKKLSLQGYVGSDHMVFEGRGEFVQKPGAKFVNKYFTVATDSLTLSGTLINYLDMRTHCRHQLDVRPECVVISGRSQKGAVGGFDHQGKWIVIPPEKSARFEQSIDKAILGDEATFNHLRILFQEALKDQLTKPLLSSDNNSAGFDLTVNSLADVKGIISAPNAALTTKIFRLSGGILTNNEATIVAEKADEVRGNIFANIVDIQCHDEATFCESSHIRGTQKSTISSQNKLTLAGKLFGNDVSLSAENLSCKENSLVHALNHAQVNAKDASIDGAIHSENVTHIEVTNECAASKTSSLGGKNKINLQAKNKLTLGGRVVGNQLVLKALGAYDQEATALFLCKDLIIFGDETKLAGKIIAYFNFLALSNKHIITTPDFFLASTRSLRIKTKLLDHEGTAIYTGSEMTDTNISLAISGDAAAEQQLLNDFQENSSRFREEENSSYKKINKSVIREIYQELDQFTFETHIPDSGLSFVEPPNKNSLALQVEILKGPGQFNSPQHYTFINSQQFDLRGKLLSYAMRIENQQPLILEKLLKLKIQHQLKIKSPELILHAKTKAKETAIKSDQFTYATPGLRTDYLTIQGQHKKNSNGIKKTNFANKVVLSQAMSGYEKNSSPKRINLTVKDGFDYQTENLQVAELLDLTVGFNKFDKPIDIDGDFKLQYVPENLPSAFSLNSLLSSKKGGITLCLGAQDLYLQTDQVQQFLKLVAEKQLEIIAGNVFVVRAGITGKDGIIFKLTGDFKLGVAVPDRHLNNSDVSSYLRQHAHAPARISLFRRSHGGGLAARHMQAITQLQKLTSDGSYLNTNGDVILQTNKFLLELATVFAKGELKGNVINGVDNYSGNVDVKTLSQFNTSVWNQRVLTQSVANAQGDVSFNSQYILTPKSQTIARSDSNFNFPITNTGGDIQCGGHAEYQKGNISGINVAAYDKHNWLEIERGRRKHRICGPRNQTFHYRDSGCVPAQQADRPQKPYIAQFTSNQQIHVSSNVSALYTEGQIQAPKVVVEVSNMNITPSAQITTTGRKYQNKYDLSQYFDETRRLFNEQNKNNNTAAIFKREHGLDSIYEKALEKIRLVYLQRDPNEVIDGNARQLYSFELQEILLQQALLDILGRSYVKVIEPGKNVLQVTLEKTQHYAEGLERNKNAQSQTHLVLDEKELRESLHELLVYQQQIWKGQSVIMPQLFLPETLTDSIENRPVAYVRADNSIEFVSKEDHSQFTCVGVIESDGEIKISASAINIISRTLTENTSALLNKRNGYITVPVQMLDRLSGNIKARQRLEINGKHYLQVGGELSSGEGGTFIEMEECILIKSQRTTTIEENKEQVSKLGCNFAIKPNFIQAKLTSKGDQLLVVTNGSAHFYGVSSHADAKNIIKAKSGIVAASQKEEYQLASLDNDKLINHKKISGSSEAVTGNQISSGKGTRLESSHGNVDLEYTALYSHADVDLIGVDVNWREGYCHHQVREKSRQMQGFSYQQIRQNQYSSQALLSTAAIAGNLRIEATHASLAGICGIIGRDLIIKAKKINFKAAVERYQNELYGKSLGISFFGSHALEALINGEKGSVILNKLLSDIPFCAAMRDLVNAQDFADVSVASIQTFVETMSMAAMVHHALKQNDPLADFCGALTDQLKITSSDKNGNRQFDPSVDIHFSSFTRSLSQSNEIGCQLSVLGTLQLEGDEIIFSGGTRIHARNISLVARNLFMLSGKRELQSRQRNSGLTVSVKPGSKQFVGAEINHQQADAQHTAHHNSVLTADETFTAHVENTIDIQGGEIEATEVKIKTQLMKLMSKQDSKDEKARGGNLGFTIDTFGNVLPKLGFNQSSYHAKETKLSQIKAKQSLHIMALRIQQIGSLIDAGEGELNVSYLYGQPILAQTINNPEAQDDSRSYYFLEGEIRGTSFETFCSVAETTCEDLFARLLQAIQARREDVISSVIEAICEWASELEATAAIPEDLRTAELTAFVEENNHEEALQLPLLDDHPFMQYLSRSNFITQFINYYKIHNCELFIENSYLFDAMYAMANKPMVIWKRHPETMSLEKVMGNDQDPNAIHVLCKNDGRLHRLFKTNSDTKYIDWTTEDLEDFKHYKSFSIALGMTEAENNEFTATAKYKQHKEKSVTHASVLVKKTTGQSVPPTANTNRTKVQEPIKKSRFSMGGHVDTKRLKEIRNFVALISQPKNYDLAQLSKEELKKLKEKTITDYKKFLKELLRNVLNDSDVVINESLLNQVVEQFFNNMRTDALSEHLQKYVDDHLQGDTEFERFCHAFYANNHQNISGSEDINSVTLGIIWLAVRDYQRNLQNNTLAVDLQELSSEEITLNKFNLYREKFALHAKRRGLFSDLEQPRNENETWSPMFFRQNSMHNLSNTSENNSAHEDHHHPLYSELPYLESGMHAAELVLLDLAPSSQTRVGAILQKELLLYDLKPKTFNLKLPTDPLKFINAHSLTRISHVIHGLEPMVAFHEALEKSHEAGASTAEAIIPTTVGTTASLVASYQLYNKYFHHLPHPPSLPGRLIEGFGNALLSTKATSGFTELTPHYFELSHDHSQAYTIANTTISTSVSLGLGQFGMFMLRIPHPVSKVIGTGMIIASDLIGNQTGDSVMGIFENTDQDVPAINESFDFRHESKP